MFILRILAMTASAAAALASPAAPAADTYPGKLSFGSARMGSNAHLSVEIQ